MWWETLRKRLAKFMARECVRNRPRLEDMHTEGKIGQEDMKELMIDVVNRTYLFLSVLASSNGSEVVEILKESDTSHRARGRSAPHRTSPYGMFLRRSFARYNVNARS
jgi:hypothetical protein